MLPPIYKSTNGLPNDRRGSGAGGGFFNDNNRKQAVVTGLSSPSRVGFPENQSDGVLSVGASAAFPPGLDRMAERVHALERENERFRKELQHLRHFYSNNQQQHENDKLSVGKVAEDLQRLAHSFNSKLQADMSHQQREQQKAALLFAEIARLGHRVEGLECELRGVVDDTQRKFETQEQHAQFMASVSSKQQHQALSPTRNAELQRQLRDMQDAMVQLRSELDADRSARWKNDAAIDAKLDAQLERLNSKLTADKRDLARVLDEQRQLVTGADFQRVTSHMREFSRVNDHLLALERWLHSEFGQIKRVFQALAGDVDARFQCVLVEIANGLKMWHAAQARQEEDLGLRLHNLEEAVRAVAVAMQRKLRTLEEVIPLEVQARQKNDDKLRRRVEGVVKALGHGIETNRGKYLPQQSTLAQRVHQLELAQRNSSEETQSALVQRVHQLELAQHHTLDEVSMQHNAMRETIQAFMEDSDAMLVRLAAAVEQERIKGIQLVTARESVSLDIPQQLVAETGRIRDELSALQARTTLHEQECCQSQQVVPMVVPGIAPMAVETHRNEGMRLETNRVKEELSALQTWAAKHAQECCPTVAAPVVVGTQMAAEVNTETKSIKEEVDALQAWTAMHEQECRQFFDFLNWSMDDIRRESAVVQCLDAVIDQIVETQACGHLNTLAKGFNGAMRQIGVIWPASTVTPTPLLAAAPPHFMAKRGRAQYTLQLPGQRYTESSENKAQSLNSEGISDMLDLSTTTYYASTDGDTMQVDRVTKNEEDREERQEARDEGSLGIPTDGVVHAPTDNDSYPYERYSESTDNTQAMGVGEHEEHPTVHINDDGEDKYSVDMTQDEEIKVDHTTITPSSPVSPPRIEVVESQGDLHNAVQPRLESPQMNESQEPLTLDL
ncbi:hypothetical protein PC129_g3655 [Phytophthora cactorum]|uniref:Uncharacterized protein n=1 Tax=Phytophthora cactorum TaxID=29920 RepID=A0A329T4M2_9STRA|nr:hypothetical protein Pcac1_g2579 [Phytophthora cactorum]KAG2837761.1 hypothetical protein PC112_g4774 [Phytophthora cactorum]KAG2841709.1 hypothetical protein PC111_g3014 [Phytophthora cactorum]KAG2869160.1 hypothetical protein PC113_g402 [Phytophthora cactorum]KAG2923189.1 hypothetical protein PC114_g4925 [Phytophthora cactorum]